jgi:hypothetical protein
MYKQIRARKSVPQLYEDKLVVSVIVPDSSTIIGWLGENLCAHHLLSTHSHHSGSNEVKSLHATMVTHSILIQKCCHNVVVPKGVVS